jgi:hypothetical protein
MMEYHEVVSKNEKSQEGLSQNNILAMLISKNLSWKFTV